MLILGCCKLCLYKYIFLLANQTFFFIGKGAAGRSRKKQAAKTHSRHLASLHPEQQTISRHQMGSKPTGSLQSEAIQPAEKQQQKRGHGGTTDLVSAI